MACAVPGFPTSFRQFTDGLAVQVAQDSACPELLIFGQSNCRYGSDPRPLAQEFSVRIKNLDSLVVTIGHIYQAFGIHLNIVRQLKFAGTGAALAPLKQEFPVVRVLHHSRIPIPVRHVKIAICRERDVGRKVEGVRPHPCDALLADLLNYLSLRVHLVDDLAGSIDHPDVSFFVDAHGMRAAGSAARVVDGR